MKFFNKDFSKFIVDDTMESRLEKEREKENARLATSQSRLAIKYGMKVIYLVLRYRIDITCLFCVFSRFTAMGRGIIVFDPDHPLVLDRRLQR